MKLQVLCATKDREGAGAHQLHKAFPGSSIRLHTIVPSAIIGGEGSLKRVARRYEGAATYLGPDPAIIWDVTLPVKNKVEDPQRMKETCFSLCKEGLIFDMEVSVLDLPEPVFEPPRAAQDVLAEDIRD